MQNSVNLEILDILKNTDEAVRATKLPKSILVSIMGKGVVWPEYCLRVVS